MTKIRVNARRHRRPFTDELGQKVRSGTKRQTIRPIPKVRPVPGDVLVAYSWQGKPYRSQQRPLGEFVLEEVRRVDLTRTSVRIAPWEKGPEEVLTTPEELNRFARADGFSGWEELLAWFDRTHALWPFEGILLRW